ncbi:sel1 repeat family protein [Ancylobacter pratisalsi]|uniref:Sel1 repeat family protein n=2 Tax=Ancylobacter pratisalsi TaxID=1745854 RepID=A0A6P1YRK8_9HYPH|nr:sel1 repeat family protein [Ancylobacter pratisalsi]
MPAAYAQAPGVEPLGPSTGATPTKAPASITLTPSGKRGPAPTPDPAYAAYQRGHFRTALDLAVKRANTTGDPVAMVLAGELLSIGYGVPQDPAAARAWFEAAAAKGNSDALFTLGAWKMEQPSTQRKDEAVALFRQSAEKGNSAAAYNLGLVYLQGLVAPKEPALAAEWFRRAANLDQVDAIYALATLYRDGNGVPQDRLETSRLLYRASELGNVVATTELAIMVFNGDGVPKDEERAAALFRKAALAGNAIAQNRYARILSAGRGVPQDKVAAATWHMMAKAQKLDDPMLDKLVASLTPEERTEAESRAKLWLSPP